MTLAGVPSGQFPRLMLQYLEPGPGVDAADPSSLQAHLTFALEHLRPTDLAFGWRSDPERMARLRASIPGDVTVWRWVPMLTHSGATWARAERFQVGPEGRAPEPFRSMDDFRFLCPHHDGVLEASIERATQLARRIGADGVMLDRIRWHSPSQSPAADLTCFCSRCRQLAADDGLDLDAVSRYLATASRSRRGRLNVVRGLLGGPTDEPLGHFVAWRRRRMTRVIGQLAEAVRGAGLRTSLDVFTPALTASVGQDLGAIASEGEWLKAMTYLDAFGPATMPYELRGYAAWLTESGEADSERVLGRSIGFAPPGVADAGPRLDVLDVERSRLVEAVGPQKAVLGIDAVELPGVCEVRDEDLDARITSLRGAGIGLAPSWELLAIGRDRIKRIAARL